MRALVTRPHGHSPFRLVYKQEAAFPPALLKYQHPMREWVDVPGEEEKMVAELEEIWRETLPQVRQRLAATDERMKREYQDQLLLRQLGVVHSFRAGDLVLTR